MSNLVQTWKDEAYRQSLSAEEQAVLPTNPAGEIELTEAELEALSRACGGYGFQPSFFDVDSAQVDQRAQTSFGGQQFTFNPAAAVAAFAPSTTQSVATDSCNIGQVGNANFWDGN